MAFELGVKVRDRVSGFEGMVTGRAEYLHSMSTVRVSPKALDTNGQPVGAVWIEEAQVEPAEAKFPPGFS